MIQNLLRKRPDAGPRPSQLIKNEISLATYSDLDAKVSFGTLVEHLGSHLAPQGFPKTCQKAFQERSQSVPDPQK